MEKTSPKFHFTLRVTAAIRVEEAQRSYVSWCPELNLYSQGEDFSTAVEALRATVQSWVKHCIRQGILDESLRKRGWSVTESGPGESFVMDGPELKKYPHTRGLEIDVPLFLVADAAQRGEIGNGSCT